MNVGYSEIISTVALFVAIVASFLAYIVFRATVKIIKRLEEES
jgi:hypothetical protein